MLRLSGQVLSLEEVKAVASGQLPVELDDTARTKMQESRAVIEKIVASGQTVYGVNTGFGKLADVRIPNQDLNHLQLNLVRSHCCGVGNPLSEPEVRAMLLLRANVLAKGLSGARPLVAQTLLQMLERGVHPVVPEQGSVGASGDLAPLAHLALTAIGEGEAFYRDERMPASRAMGLAAIAPLILEAKEGLALLNGTQAMTAVGGLALLRAMRCVDSADLAGAMTLEALLGTPAAFDARIHEARPQPGQIRSAKRLRGFLEGSEIRESHRNNDPRVQDAYSLRCMPQVHGAAWGALDHARQVLEIETGSATDNPLVFPDTGEMISGGNFHGAPLALALDYAAIALTDVMSICERRIDRLINPDLNEGLPPFLTPNPGTSSGFMIAHVTAVALLSEARVLVHPASADNAPTSGGKEDHVSMGMTSALKLRRLVDLVEKVLAIEFLCAAQGIDCRAPMRPGVGVAEAHAQVRRLVPTLSEDRVLSVDIERLVAFVRS
ncbi:MAG: histidine ammonia-lyase [Fimbriimonadaceae bacterium]|nr:histidine ammonia-lyase [Fimbriimonadaceae bacterium]